MHELSLARSLLRSVAREASGHGAMAVRRVQVRLGDLAGVEETLLSSAFREARRGTVCDGAELEIVRVPTRWICSECERLLDPDAELRCPFCDAPANLVGGAELLLERIEMEVA